LKGIIVANRYRDTYVVGNSIDLIVEVGDKVVIKTPEGYDFGIVKFIDIEMINDMALQGYEMERKANEKDLRATTEITKLEVDVKEIFESFVNSNLLEMSYVDSFFKFDRSKIVFYFTSPDRVDFRQLVRDLATEYKSRIELRQVGVRDEAKIIGGYGMCGCSLCCNSFLKEFTTIDTNMAKVQDLIINPEKISGLCGRLMCCLAYEKDFYLKEKRCYPGRGSYYTTDKGKGYVKSMNILTGIMLLQHEDGTYEEKLIERDCDKKKSNNKNWNSKAKKVESDRPKNSKGFNKDKINDKTDNEISAKDNTNSKKTGKNSSLNNKKNESKNSEKLKNSNYKKRNNSKNKNYIKNKNSNKNRLQQENNKQQRDNNE